MNSKILKSDGEQLTGPGPGKIPLDSAVFLKHVKGYSLARVTHLDIEHEDLDGLLPVKGGRFLNIKGIENGIEVELEERKWKLLVIECHILNEVLEPGKRTRTWVGGKESGVYIGFRKPEVEKLEKIASKFGVKPRKYVEQFEE